MDGNYRILVVEDEPIILNILRDFLLAKGYAVSTAPDGVAAMECVQAEEPDLVLLDLWMPRKHGFEVLQDLHRDFPQIPVIVVSATDDEITRAKVIALGASGHFSKPFNLEKIAQAVALTLQTPPGSRCQMVGPGQ